MPIEELIKLVERIKELEKACGQESFKRNEGIETLLEQFSQIVDALFLVEEDEANIGEFAKLYNKGLVSAEAMSEILLGLELSEAPVRDRIERWLKENDKKGYLMFLGCIEARNDSRQQLVGLKRNDDFFAERREYIRKLVREKYRKKPEATPFKGKGVIYTVITGGYDRLHEPKVVNKDLDYICFTDDRSMKSETWKIVQIEDGMGLDSVHLQRYYKIFPQEVLKEYDYSIYIDGKNEIAGDLQEFIEFYSGQQSMLCFPHPLRENLIQEVEEVARLGKADAGEMKRQLDQYKDLGYDFSVPIIESCVLVRSHHDEALKGVMSDWWEELNTRTHRDQLSIGYVCWKNKYQFDLCELNIYDNPYVKEIGHLKRVT